MIKIAVNHLYCTKLFALDDYHYSVMFVLLCLFCSFCLFLGRPRALSQTGIDWIMPPGSDNRHWARLVLGWVTARGRVNHLGM